MAARLALDAVARVDEHDRDVGVRGARRHVARVLLVAGAVDDDDAPRRRIEIAPGNVDGDALLALGNKAVHQQREIRVAAVDFLAPIQSFALIVVKIRRVPQQPADERRLAVVHRAARQDADHAGEILGEGGHEARRGGVRLGR